MASSLVLAQQSRAELAILRRCGMGRFSESPARRKNPSLKNHIDSFGELQYLVKKATTFRFVKESICCCAEKESVVDFL
ncbi:hypothetical protein [Paraburkholderia saeva]|uniref:hypothetical protein n=1 Tax=Paraburkholderia saeva TaxID=2777537 RepID=UPI001E5126F4|nr:hypothetical protein [Paraburkholderia saeva]